MELDYREILRHVGRLAVIMLGATAMTIALLGVTAFLSVQLPWMH